MCYLVCHWRPLETDGQNRKAELLLTTIFSGNRSGLLYFIVIILHERSGRSTEVATLETMVKMHDMVLAYDRLKVLEILEVGSGSQVIHWKTQRFFIEQFVLRSISRNFTHSHTYSCRNDTFIIIIKCIFFVNHWNKYDWSLEPSVWSEFCAFNFEFFGTHSILSFSDLPSSVCRKIVSIMSLK